MKFIENASLEKYNTFGINVSCNGLYLVEEESDISHLFANKVFDSSFMIIGDGSNILFTCHFDGAIIKMETKGIEKLKEDDDYVWLRVSAGEKWKDFVEYCIDNKYYGVENLIGIPGLVGSSPVQNIGAYSVEVKDVIDSVKGWRISTKSLFVFSNEECRFGYRSSIFKREMKGDCLITEVIYKLGKRENYKISYQGLIDELSKATTPMSIRGVAEAVLSVRNSKLPDIRKYGSAGSFFKNPIVQVDIYNKLKQQFPRLISYPAGEGMVKLAAGQLVDFAGLKGIREGNVGVWPYQALVIVNYGSATGQQVVEFYQRVQKRVSDVFGINLEPEVNIV